jgi:hypothetical protein
VAGRREPPSLLKEILVLVYYIDYLISFSTESRPVQQARKPTEQEAAGGQDLL